MRVGMYDRRRRGRVRAVRAAAVACAWAGAVALADPELDAAPVTATWRGSAGTGGNGNYGDAANWSGGVVPINNASTTYTAVIDGAKPAPSRVTVNVEPEISNLV